MERVEIVEEFAASAGRVWTLLGDFEAMAALPGVPVEIRGTGVGATRAIEWEGKRIVETLEAIDHIGYRFTYAVGGDLPLPVQALRSTCRLEPMGGLSCRVVWVSEFEVEGPPEPVKSAVEGEIRQTNRRLRAALGV
jgi:hypothetical protein